ncbi:MAG: zf-HC2 domain-containing protein [Chloroflexia bacterium]|nr:zf-HC2 domain-containing protein [Chloroflexia bacterium]
MNCNTVSIYMIDFIDNKLDNNTSHEIAKHIEECPSCKIEHTQTKELFSSIEKMPLKEPGAGLKMSFNEILEKEKAKQKAEQRSSETKTIKLKNYRILWQAAAAILLLVSGYLAGYKSKY